MDQVLEDQKKKLFDETCLRACLENEKNKEKWCEYKKKHETVIENLKYYNEKHQHSVYLPIGSKAFIKGKLVHTNDVWVTLGAGYFVKTSSKKATEICQRRIKSADELLYKYEREDKLYKSMMDIKERKPVFGSTEEKDIVEQYDEEKEKQWKAEHREKEKKYRQQLKEVKKKSSEPIVKTEKQLWEHLDLLEMEEELKDELDRLGGDDDHNDTSDETDEDSDDEKSDDDQNCCQKSHDKIQIKNFEDELNKLGYDSENSSDDENSDPNEYNGKVQNNCVEERLKKSDFNSKISSNNYQEINRGIIKHPSEINESKNIVNSKKSVKFQLPPETSIERVNENGMNPCLTEKVEENIQKPVLNTECNSEKPISRFKLSRQKMH